MTPSLQLPYELTEPVETARLLIRTMAMQDVDDIHSYQSREDVCRYLPFVPRTRDEVAAKVAQYSEAVAIAAEGDYWQLAIERRADPGHVIGDVYFSLQSTANAAGEIGWTLHPSHAGQGYMSEAAGAILEIAFAGIGLHRVAARLDPRNGPSAALCRRLGMREEAHFVEDTWFKGEWGDTWMFAILAREWEAA
ncbi:MAG TPA: GNAT family protein [Solirubrobacteraceae bacterium]|nr:GNAT family protein [Solirubrobacteraceae bacterium]